MDMAHFLGLSLLPILSPGPSTLLVVRNSLRHDWLFAVRRLLADLGGTLITATVLLYGLGAAIAASNLLVAGIQVAGACYVLIIGMRCLRHAYWPVTYSLDTANSLRGSWLESFFAGLLNPKTLVFFSLLFPLLLGDNSVHWTQPLLYSLSYSLLKGLALAAASGVFLLAKNWLRPHLRSANGTLGALLIAVSSIFLLKISNSLW
ncbi:LysE family translocator [Pseudomonas mucidolens]|uniref:LysE family translocator n=1 Tax=Pseudomonas mucidolens TaxID=46679 RepID=UPI0030DD2747